MKVLVGIKYYCHKNRGGGELYLHYFLKKLLEHTENKLNISVLIPNSKKPYIEEFEDIKIYETPENIEECEKYVKECDLLITHLYHAKSFLELSTKYNKPSILILHGYYKEFKKYIENANVIKIFNSNFVMDEYTREYIYPKNYKIIYPYTDFIKYNKAIPKTKEEQEYITLINPCENKGAKVILKLAQKMKKYKFMIVCGGYSHEEQVFFINQFRKLPNVYIQKHTDNMINDVYRRSKIILQISKYESYGMVASESASIGIPVIINKETRGLIENMGTLSLGGYGNNVESYKKCIEILDNQETYFLWSQLYKDKMEDRYNEIQEQLKDFFNEYFPKVEKEEN